MKPLANVIKNLNEGTRKQGVLIGGKVYSLHITDDEVIITDNKDYTQIYSIQTKEMFALLEADN